MVKPNYNSVDLAEVEIADDEPGVSCIDNLEDPNCLTNVLFTSITS